MTTAKAESKPEAKQPGLESRKLTKVEAGEMVKQLRESRSQYDLKKADFILACYNIFLNNVSQYYDYKSDEELIRHEFPDWKMGVKTYREAVKQAQAFRIKVRHNEEVFSAAKGKEEYLLDFMGKKIRELMKAVENKDTYFDAISQVNVIGKTKEDAEEGVTEVRRIYRDSKDLGDFEKKIKKAFGKQNASDTAKSSGSSKKSADEKGAPLSAERTSGVGVSVGYNARMDGLFIPQVAKAHEHIAALHGVSKKYADMDSDQLGTMLALMCSQINADFDLDNVPAAQRREMAKMLQVRVFKVAGSRVPPAAKMDALMKEIGAVLEKYTEN
jgi:hypothetical protein